MNIEHEPIGDPRNFRLPPICEPATPEAITLLPFKPSTREYWMNVANGKCQYEFYDEHKQRWGACSDNARHVHHIIPEGWELEHGNDPERGTGLPLCERHHVRNSGETIGERDSSFHPDISQDYKDYHTWKEQESHMRSIRGKPGPVDYSTSPFAETAQEHHRMAQRDERYWGGDEKTDEYYIQKMQGLAARSGISKPLTDPHPRKNPDKKKHWYDDTFDETTTGSVTTTINKPNWFRRRRG